MVISRLHLNGEFHQQETECDWCNCFMYGRLNLTSQHLDQVHTGPFLIMGRNNPLHVSGMNQEAFERLKIKIRGLTQCQIHTHFSFEEPVKLEEDVRLPVRDYFRCYICLLDPRRTLAFFVF